jgi:hypothetical protein
MFTTLNKNPKENNYGSDKKIPDPDIFAKNVDDAIDELFNASRDIEIDPLTNKVRELTPKKPDLSQFSQVKESDKKHFEKTEFSDPIEIKVSSQQIESFSNGKTLELEPNLEIQNKETNDSNIEQQFGQLHQTLLTLEWEVTRTHVISAKNLIKTIQENSTIKSDKKLHQLLNRMTMILDQMEKHPEKMPTCGPKVLQKSLNILKKIVWNKEQNPKIREKLLKQAEKELDTAIDIKISKISGDSNDQKGVAIIEKKLSEANELGNLFKSHIKVLGECIDYILPVGELLARTPGMEKLYHFQQNIKSRLERQKKILEKALNYECEPSVNINEYNIHQTTSILTENDKKLSSGISCPWKELVIGQWDQKQIAFVPKDIVFSGTISWWTKKRINKMKTFKLKNLKSWPWKKIQPLVQGELSKQKESQLIETKFPILQKSSSSRLNENSTILILSNGNKGLVLLMDTPVEKISITPEYLWEPCAKISGPWIGNLKIENKQISVTTLESLLNSMTNEQSRFDI